MLQIVDDGGIDVELCPQSTTVVTILDNDELTVALTDMEYTVTEGNAATILITASSAASELYTVNITTSPGTADEADYTPGPYVATFNPRETIALVSISTQDTDCAEPLEAFRVDVQPTTTSAELGVTIGSPSQANVVIRDPTVVPVHFDNSSYETDEGETFNPAIIVDQCYSGTFSINVTTADGTATAGMDYNAVGITVIFNGNQRANITIHTIDDTAVEDMETFNASLSADNIPAGLNVQIDPPSAIFTIQDEEILNTVSFARERYNVNEGDSVAVQFVVTEIVSTPFEVTVVSANGTAYSGVDYMAIDENVDPTVDKVTVVAFVDEVTESVESFQLYIVIPPTTPNVQVGSVPVATVFITDLGARTVNDTIVADPVYAVPLKVVDGNIPGLSGDVSLCYEIHGSPDTWFNLISDTCLSVNAHYARTMLPDDEVGHQIDRLGALVVSNADECREIMVSMVERVCSFTVNGSSVEMFDEDGVMVTKRRNRVRISAPNCDNQMVVIWAVCEKFAGMDIMRVVVNRGFNLNPTSHGFIGQFWNIDVSLERYNDTIVKELFNRDSVNPHYVIHLDPPAPAEKRSLVGELYHKQWDRSYKPCLYAGSVQGGAGNDELKPVGTVIEGSYTDYIASGPFKHAEKFNRFNKDLCGV
jgi:collagen type VI alpha